MISCAAEVEYRYQVLASPMRWLGLGVLEKAQVVGLGHPPVAARQVVAEIERLLMERHEDLRVPAQLFVEGGAATLEGADNEEIGSGHAAEV